MAECENDLAEVIVVYIVATRFFYDKTERAYKTLKDRRYIGRGLSKEQLNVRLPGKIHKCGMILYRYFYPNQLEKFNSKVYCLLLSFRIM